MSQKDETTTEEAGGAQSCPDMCRRMMTGDLPENCGAKMREMMSRGLPENWQTRMGEMMSKFLAATQGTESKPKEAV